ncbi:MAG: polysaccharide deacetylase family protein [Clostridia bacterium]|nr:polysaccharide deacetylase family protein [Clostridia bacterium]
MKMNRSIEQSLKIKLATNLVLSVLILSIGALCLSPMEESVTTKSDNANVYRCADEAAEGVSLMFNVYWGTDEVYRILCILSEYDAKATFFIGGCWADDNVDCLKAIYDAGHEIGNHGYFHKDHTQLNESDNQREINDCNRFIQLAIGVKPTLFAPPSGAYNGDTVAVATELGMSTILWSKDTIDWRDKNAALIYSRATKNVGVGDFILMHPIKETADALPDILKFYQKSGLKSVTVSQNLQKEG